jgi:hypothetical protein
VGLKNSMLGQLGGICAFFIIGQAVVIVCSMQIIVFFLHCKNEKIPCQQILTPFEIYCRILVIVMQLIYF